MSGWVPLSISCVKKNRKRIKPGGVYSCARMIKERIFITKKVGSKRSINAGCDVAGGFRKKEIGRGERSWMRFDLGLMTVPLLLSFDAKRLM